jgi:predicted nucleotidyltransferase component of viral defense system
LKNGASLDFWPDSLTDLQHAVLEGLSERAPFYLSGGAALSAFYLHHRRSLDLDLFVSEVNALDRLEDELRTLCHERGWTADELRRYPGFRRFLLRDGADETVVDLVHEPVAQIVPESAKPTFARLTVDSLDDLIANKLCALLGRGDIKDLVDLYFMTAAGIDVLDHFEAARSKDGGMEATWRTEPFLRHTDIRSP